ncbi:MAG: hypothetical protein C4521_03015 [Actinobacteria bacterium]|nr:MAG: hypothetical protein C4521_03015 [Actinomycetota bacterium]
MFAILPMPEINVWLDMIFFTVFFLVVIVFSVHLLFNFLTGRMYRRFVKDEWPTHDVPLRPIPKFLHFQHVMSMIGLGFSGMYIRFPFFSGGRTAMRYLHYFLMIVVIVNLFARLAYAFTGRHKDKKMFAITKRDLKAAPQVVMYYVFARPTKPHVDHYNVMQKATYCLFPILLLAQAYTGFSLLTTVFGFDIQPLFLWWPGIIGIGVAAGAAYSRILHYVINWLFIILTFVHAYLSITEDFPAFREFFGVGKAKYDLSPHGAHAPVGEPEPVMAHGTEGTA